MLNLTVRLQNKKKLWNIKKKSRSFFRYFVQENKKIQKKPQSKIGIAAVMPMNQNRVKISKIAGGDSFLVWF